MLGTVAWRTELKGESGFQRDQALWRSQWLGAASWGQVMEDKHEPLSQVLLPASPAAAEQVSEQIHYTRSWNSHCTGPLQFSIILWEKGGGENSIEQKDIKNDRREKEKHLVPRPILTSVHCRSRRRAQISSGPSDRLIAPGDTSRQPTDPLWCWLHWEPQQLLGKQRSLKVSEPMAS